MTDPLTETVRSIVREEIAKALKAAPPRPCDCDRTPKRFLNSDEAAAYCGFRGGGQTMRDFKQHDPDLPVRKLGRLLVFDREELDTWLEKRASRRSRLSANPLKPE